MALLARRRPRDIPAADLRRALTVVAAASRIEPSERATAAIRKRREDWQSEAWNYYDTLGEIWFAMRFVGNSFRRIRLHLGFQLDPSEPAVPVTREDLEQINTGSPDAMPLPPQAVEAGLTAMARLQSTAGGQSEILGEAGMNLALAGEWYLIGRDDPDNPAGESWEVYSTDEFTVDSSGQWILKESPGDQGTPIENSASVIRVWRRHPRWSALADAPMRALLDEAEELLLLSRAVRGSARSQANAGLLTIPEELSLAGAEGVDDTGDGTESEDEFIAALMRGLVDPITDEGHANAVAPIVVRGPSEFLDKIRRVDLSRTIDATQAAQRGELIKRMATGLDLPPEVLLGMAEVNHWSAWQIEESTFKAHIEPLVIINAAGLTAGYLHPALKDANAFDPRLVVAYDAVDLVRHVDQSANADNAWDRLTISDTTYRRAKGFAEDDAPDDDERARRLEDLAAAKANQNRGDEDLPAGPENVEPGPPPPPTPAAEPSPPDPPAVASSASPNGHRPGRVTVIAAAVEVEHPGEQLGRRLYEIDKLARLQLHEVLQQHVRRALEKAGSRIVSRLGTKARAELKASVADVPKREVAAALGRNVVAQLGFDEDDLLDEEWNDLGEDYDRIVSRAQASTRGVFDDFGLDTAGLEERQNEHRVASWAFAAGAVAELASAALYENKASRAEAVTGGEFDPTATVPYSMAGDLVTRAGGGEPLARSFDPVPGRIGPPPGVTTPDGGIATGDDVHTMLSSLGLVPEYYIWDYGDPATREMPFLPHFDLDGFQFRTLDEGLLGYYPGDHKGCQCESVPVYPDSPLAPTDEGTDLVSRALRGEGFTVRPGSGVEPKTGYAVATSGNEQIHQFVPGQTSREDVKATLSQYVRERQQDFYDGRIHLGGWGEQLDDGSKQFVLDLTEVIPNRTEAELVARSRGERAIWDLAEGAEITTKPGPPTIREAEELARTLNDPPLAAEAGRSVAEHTAAERAAERTLGREGE